MPSADSPDRSITRTLLQLASAAPGERRVVEERLFDHVYAELRTIAMNLMRAEREGHSLEPAELVHEAYLRLVAGDHVGWESRAHFFGAAARSMRQILVDHARRRGANKRGGGWTRVTLHPDLAAVPEPEGDLISLDDCLTRMSALDTRMTRVVELRVFAGMTIRDVACVLGVSQRTVDDDWAIAKRWLRRELAGDA